MRYEALSTRLRFAIAVAIALVCVAVMIIRPQPSTALQTEPNEFQKKLYALVRRGVGAEVSFARPNAPIATVRSSVNSVASFIRKRSGLELSTAVIERLARMEGRALAGASRRITADELSDILTKTLLERIQTLTDAEIGQAAETLRGFNAPDLPDPARASRRNVRLRADQLGALTPESFVAQTKALRDSGTIAVLLTSRARETVGREARNRLETFSNAVPEQWGNVSQGGITPLQAFLTAYSVVSDDYLWYSESELRGMMKSIEKILTSKYGHYPSPDGRFAYGANGYIYATPLDLVFDKRTPDRLLDRVEERSAK
jgi:hypothetical protein